MCAASAGASTYTPSRPTGLKSGNVSTAQDLVKMVLAAQSYSEIRDATTSSLDKIKKSYVNYA